MAHSHSDRRRFFLATAITLLALPALWWANQSRQSAPNVATAGVAVGDASDPTAPAAPPVPSAAPGTPSAAAEQPVAPEAPAEETAAPEAPEGSGDADPPPVFLDGPAGHVGAGLPEVAVPATTGERIQTRATYRSNLPTSTCLVGNMSNGLDVVVVNLDNGRSVRCTTALAPFSDDPILVMSRDQFLEIADPTDAPIPVEIRR